jgi:stage V sporulation protein D (sporulation-specific penicillin-binding protein)
MRRSRVLVAAAGLFFGLLVLWARIGWIQLFEHGYYSIRAEEIQEQRVLQKPQRGNLLDRHGRVLARDLATYAVSAAPREMHDPPGTARELAALLKRDPRALVRDFSRRPRYLEIQRQVSPEVAGQIAALKERGVYLSRETGRVYPLGSAAAEILGRTDLDNAGIDGLELQLDDDLHGRPGWATRFRDGRGRAHDLLRGLRRPPVDGNDVVLTLDSDLQSIVETRLTDAIDSLHALRGFALFMDPRTGEILACVNVPHLPPGKARNWNFTDTYEPGSTFKMVVAGAALEENLARPDQVFTASASGQLMLVPGAVFHDTHKEAQFTFRDAVRFSSNIVMGKLGLMVGPERLYRYATALGFGAITGVDFPGEAGGRLRSPDRWSGRSAPTIAIGHEVTVTPLQLVLAYAAVANGGVLMHPQLVREVRGPDGRVVRRVSPEAAQRVFSEHTTTVLRGMLQAVVDSGTAKAARVPGLAIAGKTGTAQKYLAGAGGYAPGVYISSFAGFVPADQPRLVGIVVVDEPKGKHYYGGEVAAPVFRQVLLDLRGLPSGPLAPNVDQIASRPPAPAPVVVPDLRLLPPDAAEHRLAALGLRPVFQGNGPRVLAQDPVAGIATERGSRVDVWLAAPADSAGQTLPDLAGVPVREALRELTARQVPAKLVGHGTVVRMDPPPGTRLPLSQPCVLTCEPRPMVLPAAAPDPSDPSARTRFAVRTRAEGGRP